jgi:hypothetical protein
VRAAFLLGSQGFLHTTKTASSKTDEAVIRSLNFIKRKRTMRKFIRASVLILALTVPAFAGEIPNGVTGYIPNGATAAGDIQNGVTGDIPYGVTFIDALLALFSLI